MNTLYKNRWLPTVLTALPLCLPSPGSAAKPATATEPAIEERLPAVTVVAKQPTREDGSKSYVVERSLSATKTDTPLLETPQSISVVTQKEIAARASQSITQAVAYTPGVVSGLFGPSTRDDYFNLRGFSGTQYLDGTRLMNSGTSYAQLRVDPYGLERIEVLRGPASVLYGQNPPGGLVNTVSKRPTEQPFHEVQLLGGSFDRIQGGFDFAGPVKGRDDVLYRLVGLARNSGTQVDFVNDDRYFIAPSLTWKPSDRTSLTFLSHYQKDKTGDAMQFLPYEGTVLPNPNGPIPSNRFLGEPNFNSFVREQFAVGYALEHQFNETIKARQNLRYDDITSNYRGIYPDFYYGFDYDQGRLIPGASFVNPEMSEIFRFGSAFDDRMQTFTLDNQLQADVVTGSLRHTFLAGLDFRQFSAQRNNGSTDIDLPELILDVYNPQYGNAFPPIAMTQKTDQSQSQTGLYGQDQVRLGRWLATVGVRYDWATMETITADQDDPGRDGTTLQNEQAFTYRTGLNYLFDSGVAPYYSYSESFEPLPGTTFLGATFQPSTGRQHEFGVKYQPLGYDALFTAAWFNLTQQNILTPDPNPAHFGFSVQTGAARSQGVELEGKIHFDIGLDAVASYTYTDTEVTQTNTPAELGKRLTYTPEHQAGLWLDYTQPRGVLAGLGMGSGLRYADGNFGDLSNSQKTPAYVLIDAAVHYDIGKLDNHLRGMRLAVNMSNLFDEQYFTTCFGGSCFFGDRRTVLASLRYTW